MIKSTYNRGFILSFSNGFSVSAQYGSVTDKQNGLVKNYNDLQNPITQSIVAIISIFDSNGKALVIEDSTLVERQTADDIADWITKVRNATCKGDIVGTKEEPWE